MYSCFQKIIIDSHFEVIVLIKSLLNSCAINIWVILCESTLIVVSSFDDKYLGGSALGQ